MTSHQRPIQMARPHRSPYRYGRYLVVIALAASASLALATTVWAAPMVSAAPPVPPPAAGTPCELTVKACARLSSNEAWLTDGRGTVITGPVRMNHGAPGQETPTGRFSVQWKNKDHFSREAGGTPMPYSVFFDGHGRAFHGGDPARQSAGCVRLPEHIAKTFFDSLQPGDQVQILP